VRRSRRSATGIRKATDNSVAFLLETNRHDKLDEERAMALEPTTSSLGSERLEQPSHLENWFPRLFASCPDSTDSLYNQ